MQRLKSKINKLTKLEKRGISINRLVNVLTIIAFTIGLIALFSLIWFHVRPIKTANIKVPVATDQPSYKPGDTVSGIFFGETFYNGEVRILREVFCKNYKGVIKPPKNSAVGDFFSTQARKRVLEGETITIGSLPEDVPVGLNCVLQFTNIYTIQTPFGVRHEEYQYYTQNFAIISPEGSEELYKDQETTEPIQSSPETSQPRDNDPNSSNTRENNRPTEPAPRQEERCVIDLIVRVGCRDVEAN